MFSKAFNVFCMAWHYRPWAYSKWHLFAYISHKWAEWSKKTDSLERVGVPNTFPMRNRSPCPVFDPQWPCVISIAFIFIFASFFDFPCLSDFTNRLGGDSTFCFLYHSFSLVFLHLFAVTHHSAIELFGHMVTGTGDSAGDTRLRLSFFRFSA